MSSSLKIRGSAKVRLDDKGRISVPSRFRETLLSFSGLMLGAHPHGCLVLYTDMDYEKLENLVAKMSNMEYSAGLLEETIVGTAEEVSIDSVGRVSVPNHLREMAKIHREVFMFGVVDSIRIWDVERWEQRRLFVTSKLQDGGIPEEWKKIRT